MALKLNMIIFEVKNVILIYYTFNIHSNEIHKFYIFMIFITIRYIQHIKLRTNNVYIRSNSRSNEEDLKYYY